MLWGNFASLGYVRVVNSTSFEILISNAHGLTTSTVGLNTSVFTRHTDSATFDFVNGLLVTACTADSITIRFRTIFNPGYNPNGIGPVKFVSVTKLA